jgi:glucosamine--fructose-6-phosphate aminotransferase (isomerizing)
MADQPFALKAFVDSKPLNSVSSHELSRYDRIILTGMGASHYSALPTWRRLVALGLPAWWLSTSELLDSRALLRDGSLLWITSQSGRSGEIVALLDEISESGRPRCIIGVTSDLDSPLGKTSDIAVDLCCGPEATVSTKSYINSLAAHHLLLVRFAGGDEDGANREILDAAVKISSSGVSLEAIKAIATEALSSESPRFALIGAGDQAASALYGALVIKEACKLQAEGFIGGEFRHGPFELAGPGLTAVLYRGHDEYSDLSALSADLRRTGSQIVELPSDESSQAPDSTSTGLRKLMTEAVFAQMLSVELARARGITPGEFRFGQKITSSL